MRKISTLLACAVIGLTSYAQQGAVVSLSVSTFDKETTDAKGGTDWYFTGTDIYLNMSGRTWKEAPRQDWNEGLNFKNNTKYTIQLGDNKAYRVEFAGYSLGDNWDYLYAYGVDDADGYEWTDPIGQGVKDNETIIKNAKYPLDPCESTQGAPVFYKAGYKWAALDFGNEPYEGTFPFFFSGNNQEQTMIIIYTTRAAADEAAVAYVAPDYTNSAIESTICNKQEAAQGYDILGRPVSNEYKGLVIKNGRKYIQR